jgi:hypothetical protein
LVQKPALRHPIKIATIRLQWNQKAKMMQAVRIFTAGEFPDFTSVEAAASSDDKKDLFK